MSLGGGRHISALRGGARRRGERKAAAWSALNRVLALLIFAGIALALVLWIAPELVRRSQLAAELDAQRTELAREQALRKKREREKFLLENDPEYVETIARDKLNLMKEGETIFRLDVPTPTPAP